MDMMTMAMCKGKIIELNDYGINLMSLMATGVAELDCSAFIDEVVKTVRSKRLPILHDETLLMYIFPTGVSTMQVTASVVGAQIMDGNYTFIKGDIVFLREGVRMFTAVMS